MWIRLALTTTLFSCGFQSSAPLTTGDAGPPDAAPEPEGDARPEPAPDRDGDGIADGMDNCRERANSEQFDEDGDGIGDACDICPHIADKDQGDDDRDGVGDVCDPRPDDPGDHIVLFLGFNRATDIAGWQTAGTNAHFAVHDGELTQDGDSDLAFLWKNDLGARAAWITTQVSYRQLGAFQFRGASIVTRWTRMASNDFGDGGGCGEMIDQTVQGGMPFYNVVKMENGAFLHMPNAFNSRLAAGYAATYTVHGAANTSIDCIISQSPNARTYAGDIAAHGGSGINFAVWGAKVAFKYLVVID